MKKRTSLRISIAYIVTALLWIFVSDWALFRFVPDTANQEALSMIKGFGFVLVTGMFLYFLLRSWVIGRQISILTATETLIDKPVNPNFMLGVFVALSVTIMLTGYFVATHINRQIRANEHSVLNAVAELKAGEVESWLTERWNDMNLLAADQGYSSRVRRWLQGDGSQKEHVVARLTAIQNVYQYVSVALYDPDGKLRLEIGRDYGAYPVLNSMVKEAVRTGETQFSDLYAAEDIPGHVHLDLVAPLTSGNGARRAVVGVVVLHTDPHKHLFSLIQHWPLKSRSGETLLVRRDGDDVLFLNELRHRPDTALRLRLPVARKDLPAARALRGESGEFEGRDYRGVPVFSVARPIRGTSWQLVAKIDREEVLAPTHRVHLVSAAVTLLAITLAGLMVGFGWRQQMRNFALRQRMHEVEKQVLTKHFEYLSRNANDIIVLTDNDLNIVEVNERTVEISGYSRKELIGSRLSSFRSAAASKSAAQDYARIASEGRLRYETEWHLRDGKDLPVEVSAARVEVEGRNYYQFILRDITERRRHEKQLMTARDFYIKILNDFPNLIWRADTSGRCDYFNNAWLEFTGRPLEQELGEGWVEGVHPDDRDSCLDIYREAFAARRAFQMDYRLRHAGGEYRWITDHGKPIIDDDGNFLGYIGACYDIHDSRVQEERLRVMAEELAEQKNRLETVLATTPDHVYLHDRDGRYVLINDAALKMLGLCREQAIGRTWEELGMLEEVLRPFHEERAKVLADKTPVTGQLSYPTVNGPRDYAYTISPVTGSGGEVLATVTTATDVTEHIRNERRIERLSHMYATLSHCNKSIVRIRDRQELFHEICRIIVEHCRFRFAWIGWLDKTWQELAPLAYNGAASEYLSDVHISLGAGKGGRKLPPGKAVLEGRHVIANDILSDPDTGPWRERAKRAGIAATASFPIREQGKIVGTLNVCSDEPGYFNDDLVGLLDEMASDISFALDNYRQAEALRRNESTLRLFFDLPFIGMAVTSPRSRRWLQVNQTLCDMLGYPREELVTRTWEELTHPDDLAVDVANFERVMRREIDSYKLDKRYVRKDGQIVYATIDVQCIRDGAGNVDFFVATIADITGRKREEAARAAEEDRYLRQRNALIALSTGSALAGNDLEAAFRQITEADARTLGVSRVSIWRYNRDQSAIRCVDLYEGESNRHSSGMELSAADYPAYFRALAQKDVIAADDAHHDPRTREFSESYLRPLGISSMMDAPIHLGDRLEGVLCREHVGPQRQWTADEKNFAVAIANLVSLTIEGWERKRNQENLAAATEQFQGLVEQSIAGIFISVDGRYVYVNPRLAEILGGSPEEFVGHEVTESIVESDRAQVRASLERCLSGEEESQMISFVGRRRHGSTVDMGAHINRATHAGTPAVIGVVQDISEKKRSEERIQDYIHRLERGMFSTIRAVSVMSELRDPYTYGHEQRVGDLAGAIAQEMGLDVDVVKGLQIAGYVHDIGKIVVPAEILAKPTKLTKAEFELIKSHPQQGYEVLKEIDFPWPVAQVALQHHERFDGSGYPQGLKGDEIIREARILAVADVVEAMAAHRPYRPSLGIELALEEVIKHRGAKYDSEAVDACVRLFRERGYRFKQVI